MSDEWRRPFRIFLGTKTKAYYTPAIRTCFEDQVNHIIVDDPQTADLIVIDTVDGLTSYETIGKPIAFIISSREYQPERPGVHILYLGNFLVILRDLIREIQFVPP